MVEIPEEKEDGDAPAPRPETPDHSPDPFQGDPATASILADPFSTKAAAAIREARGEPAPTYHGEWGEDSTGHPVRVEELRTPYDGRVTFRVQAMGKPDPAAIEAKMGWKMLDRMDMDTVWLHLYLLAYASAPNRENREIITIPRRPIEKVFGFRNRNHTVRERAEKIKRHVEALQSVFVQFQEVRRNGDKLRFSGDMTATPLWNLQMTAEGEKDLFTGETIAADWHLKAKEGIWAQEFLKTHGDQWTHLPKNWFEKIDRRGSRHWAQRLAVYLLFQFRINAKNGNRVKRTAETLLKVCGEDLGATRSTKRRTELKRCLSRTLDRLKHDYQIQVHAERVHMDHTSGLPHDEWRSRTAMFDPPPSMDGKLFRRGRDPKPLPNVAGGDWKPEQIRTLRTETLDWTQSELGERLDVSKQYVSQLERGTSSPSDRVRKTLDRIHSRHG
jgi:hypothetical protein